MRAKTAVILGFACGSFVVLAARAVSQSVVSNSSGAEQARVFVQESESWEIYGASGGSEGVFGGEGEGGARPQTVEIIKTFNQRCPDVIINNIRSKADYVVVLEHEGGKGLRHKNKVAVFTRVTGDSLVSKSTFSLGGAVEEACLAMRKDWEKHSAAIREAESQDSPDEGKLQPASESSVAKLSVASTPVAADIFLDGGFVGNTPCVLDVPAGEHTVKITKGGYKTWERKIRVQGSSVNLTAELEVQAN